MRNSLLIFCFFFYLPLNSSSYDKTLASACILLPIITNILYYNTRNHEQHKYSFKRNALYTLGAVIAPLTLSVLFNEDKHAFLVSRFFTVTLCGALISGGASLSLSYYLCKEKDKNQVHKGSYQSQTERQQSQKALPQKQNGEEKVYDIKGLYVWSSNELSYSLDSSNGLSRQNIDVLIQDNFNIIKNFCVNINSLTGYDIAIYSYNICLLKNALEEKNQPVTYNDIIEIHNNNHSVQETLKAFINQCINTNFTAEINIDALANKRKNLILCLESIVSIKKGIDKENCAFIVFEALECFCRNKCVRLNENFIFYDDKESKIILLMLQENAVENLSAKAFLVENYEEIKQMKEKLLNIINNGLQDERTNEGEQLCLMQKKKKTNAELVRNMETHITNNFTSAEQIYLVLKSGIREEKPIVGEKEGYYVIENYYYAKDDKSTKKEDKEDRIGKNTNVKSLGSLLVENSNIINGLYRTLVYIDSKNEKYAETIYSLLLHQYNIDQLLIAFDQYCPNSKNPASPIESELLKNGSLKIKAFLKEQKITMYEKAPYINCQGKLYYKVNIQDILARKKLLNRNK